MAFEIRVESKLSTTPEVLWARVCTMEGVNEELSPWVRMSVPSEARGHSLNDVALGELAFRSWLLLLGFLPFDRHALCLVEMEPGRRFLERSSSFLQKLWEHERIVEPCEGGARIVDRLKVEPRLFFVSLLSRFVVRALFRHRHRRLRRRFGTG